MTDEPLIGPSSGARRRPAPRTLIMVLAGVVLILVALGIQFSFTVSACSGRARMRPARPGPGQGCSAPACALSSARTPHPRCRRVRSRELAKPAIDCPALMPSRSGDPVDALPADANDPYLSRSAWGYGRAARARGCSMRSCRTIQTPTISCRRVPIGVNSASFWNH